MFKKIKELIKKIKELRKNEQTKTLIDLGLWIIFFFIIVIVLRGMGSTQTINKIEKKEDTITSYEYTYQDSKLVINGQNYKDKESFIISDNKYYFNGEKTYKIINHAPVEENFDLGLLKINLNLIENLTAGLEPTNNNNIKTYMVPLVRFLNLYEIDTDVDLTLASNYNIIVNKYYKEDKLYMIKIDLSNYYKIKNIEDSGTLTIDIYNLNKVSDFTKDYDELLGVRR